MTLNRIFTDEAELSGYIESLLGARVHEIRVRRIDQIQESTSVEVRIEALPESASQSPNAAA